MNHILEEVLIAPTEPSKCMHYTQWHVALTRGSLNNEPMIHDHMINIRV